MNDQTQKYFILGFIILLIVTLIVLFIVRYTVFKTGKYLTTLPEEELKAQGYGTYSDAFSTGCLTSSGKCTLPGVKYTTQYCVPHPDTGKGCLTQNGEMTFASQTISENCLPSCRTHVLQEQNNTEEYSTYSAECVYPAPFNNPTYPCITKAVRPYKFNIMHCKPNDAVGENACNYVCGSDGVGPNGVHGDSDPTLPSYIPNCVGNKGNMITLQSFNYNLIGQIPDNGFTISKGYKITNYIPVGASGPSYNFFNVSPPYLAPSSKSNPNPGPTGTISLTDLFNLDTQLVVLENCTPSGTKSKPFCQSLYTYTPTDIGSNTTYTDKKLPPLTTNNIFQTANCYVDPYWNSPPASGYEANYINPYSGSGPNSSPYTMTSGIGQFGIAFEYEACESSSSTLQPVSNTDPQQYFLPAAYTTKSQCLPLTSVGNTGPYTGNCYSDKNYIPITFSSGKNYTICDTVYPNGSRPLGYNGSTPVPGLATRCQYMPNREVIDFSGATTGGIILDPELQNLIGGFVQLRGTDPITNKRYFLGLQTSPCVSGIDSSTLPPLTNCLALDSDLSNGYNDQRCMFVYDAGSTSGGETGAGIYWDKLNCDSEMISLSSSLSLIFSPRTINSSTNFDCDIYGYFGNIFGQLYVNGTNLNFKPFTPDQEIDNTKYDTSNQFVVNYSSGNLTISYLNPSPGSLNVLYFDGITFSSSNSFDIANSTSIVLSNTRIPFTGKVIKSNNGINPGSNITSVLTNQRANPCYYNNCDPDIIDLDNPCFPDTCNLYYKYNSNTC